MKKSNHILKKRLQTIVMGFVSLGGIIAIVLDFSLGFFSESMQLLVTFATSLMSFITILTPLLENYYQRITIKCEKEQITNVLKLYGVNTETREEVSNVHTTCKAAICDLVYLISQSLHKCEGSMINGATSYGTDFYVYTLAASHVEKNIQIMVKYISKLISEIQERIIKNSPDEYPLFYLIVPYGRNIILADEVSKVMKLPILISQVGKIERDTGSNITVQSNPYEFLYRNFHGLDSLKQYIKTKLLTEQITCKTISLNGIIVDCNVTSASSYTVIADFFNEKIFSNLGPVESKLEEDIVSNMMYQDYKIKFNTINYGATLFMAHDSARAKLIENLKRADLNLFFYFELSEDAKSLIYKQKESINCSQEITIDNMSIVIDEIAPLCHFRKIRSREDKSLSNLIHVLPEDEKTFTSGKK